MAAFTCSICFEQCLQRLRLPKKSTGNGDVIRGEDCEHPICKQCLASHIRVRVEEQRVFDIRCPALGCKAELFQSDLQSLVQSGELENEVCERFVELRARDYGERVRGFEAMRVRSEEDVEFLGTLRSMRQCPRCQLLLQRSAGCDSFYCICGAHFNYRHGQPGIGGKTKTWDKTLQLALQEKMSLAQAQQVGGSGKRLHRVELTAQHLGISLAEAAELHERAKRGDADARAQIRQGRAAFSEKAAEAEGAFELSQEPAEIGPVELPEMPMKPQKLECAPKSPVAQLVNRSESQSEARVGLDLLAIQILTALTQSLQPPMPSAGRAPGVPDANARRSMASFATTKHATKQLAFSRAAPQQSFRRLGRRGH